jgi:predicted GIY-YIG superfamily endonuclease
MPEKIHLLRMDPDEPRIHAQTITSRGILAMSERQESGRTFVYRAFDSYGDLLYVGMTKDLVARIKDHTRQSPAWITQMATLTAVTYWKRAEACAAESKAIRTECPIYNVVGSRNGDTARYLSWLAGQARYGQPKPETETERWVHFYANFDEYVRVWRMATEAERSAGY